MKRIAPDLAGMKFGRLVVIEKSGISKHKETLWKCDCECGGSTIASTNDLRRGHTKSCGCLRTINALKKTMKHGMSENNMFFVWNTMKERCFNSKSNAYKGYGGRGIRVCDEWKDDFQAFYNYVSQLPHFGEEGYSLDRINNDGNYEPGNVKWSTTKEQANNRRNNVRVIVNGAEYTLAELAEITGINYNTLYSRYRKNKTLI